MTRGSLPDRRRCETPCGLRERRQLSTRLQSQRDAFLAGSDLAQDASSPDPQGQDGSPCGTGAVQMDAGQAGRAVTAEITGMDRAKRGPCPVYFHVRRRPWADLPS
jgi:hypothetical protein